VDKRRAEGSNSSFQMCVKPLIGLFHSEKQNSVYRQFLSNPQNYKKYESFSEFMEAAMQIYEQINP
jgi:hypothetical protein